MSEQLLESTSPTNKPSNKRISVLVDMDIITKIENSDYNQTTAVTKGLEMLFSTDYVNIHEYQDIIRSYEDNINILTAKLNKFDETIVELNKVHQLLSDQQEMNKAHIVQVQTLIDQIKSRDDSLQIKNKEILMLENKSELHSSESKKKWYKFW